MKNERKWSFKVGNGLWILNLNLGREMNTWDEIDLGFEVFEFGMDWENQMVFKNRNGFKRFRLDPKMEFEI